MGALLVGSALWVTAIVLAWRAAQRSVSTTSVARRLDALHQDVRAWQAAHDHQIEALDRRMQRVEEAAARAETEARMIANVVMGEARSS